MSAAWRERMRERRATSERRGGGRSSSFRLTWPNGATILAGAIYAEAPRVFLWLGTWETSIPFRSMGRVNPDRW